ncbi:hypothetical protein QAD02_013284 [Eretmocerus hayati]|uniref:Uncharacterized protein n=1 Tax=Eretmocerus hayati TaxID=131215 RepID=A0ACC2P287_9HYME|nr:hypothetical protein QAD02_013284 [Eretmocerus hayati]
MELMGSNEKMISIENETETQLELSRGNVPMTTSGQKNGVGIPVALTGELSDCRVRTDDKLVIVPSSSASYGSGVREKFPLPVLTERKDVESVVVPGKDMGNINEGKMRNSYEPNRDMNRKRGSDFSDGYGNFKKLCIRTTGPSDDHVKEAQKIVNRPAKILTVQMVKDQLILRDDQIVHFMSLDFVICTPVCQQLVDLNLIDTQKLNRQPHLGLGAVVCTAQESRKNIYTLFLKEKYDDPPSASRFIFYLGQLKCALLKAGLKSLSLAKNGDGLETLNWDSVEQALKLTWAQEDIQLTLCTGEITVPNVEDRLGIIRECHDSLWGGHKGQYKTFEKSERKRVEKRMSWIEEGQDPLDLELHTPTEPINISRNTEIGSNRMTQSVMSEFPSSASYTLPFEINEQGMLSYSPTEPQIHTITSHSFIQSQDFINSAQTITSGALNNSPLDWTLVPQQDRFSYSTPFESIAESIITPMDQPSHIFPIDQSFDDLSPFLMPLSSTSTNIEPSLSEINTPPISTIDDCFQNLLPPTSMASRLPDLENISTILPTFTALEDTQEILPITPVTPFIPDLTAQNINITGPAFTDMNSPQNLLPPIPFTSAIPNLSTGSSDTTLPHSFISEVIPDVGLSASAPVVISSSDLTYPNLIDDSLIQEAGVGQSLRRLRHEKTLEKRIATEYVKPTKVHVRKGFQPLLQKIHHPTKNMCRPTTQEEILTTTLADEGRLRSKTIYHLDTCIWARDPKKNWCCHTCCGKKKHPKGYRRHHIHLIGPKGRLVPSRCPRCQSITCQPTSFGGCTLCSPIYKTHETELEDEQKVLYAEELPAEMNSDYPQETDTETESEDDAIEGNQHLGNMHHPTDEDNSS